jgi:hypothetical protein
MITSSGGPSLFCWRPFCRKPATFRLILTLPDTTSPLPSKLVRPRLMTEEFRCTVILSYIRRAHGPPLKRVATRSRNTWRLPQGLHPGLMSNLRGVGPQRAPDPEPGALAFILLGHRKCRARVSACGHRSACKCAQLERSARSCSGIARVSDVVTALLGAEAIQ